MSPQSLAEVRSLFDPVMREQLRGVIAAHALSGLLSGMNSNINNIGPAGVREWRGAPAMAVELADATLKLLDAGRS